MPGASESSEVKQVDAALLRLLYDFIAPSLHMWLSSPVALLVHVPIFNAGSRGQDTPHLQPGRGEQTELAHGPATGGVVGVARP
jgi:hypothetical protein